MVLLPLGCTTQLVPVEEPQGDIIFKAYNGDNPETKTALQSDGSIVWCASDEINLFYGDSHATKFTSTNTDPAASVDFRGSLTGFEYNDSDSFWAVYPYNEENTCDGGSVTVSLPAGQTAVAGTFADDLYIGVAQTKDFNLMFYNVCGGIKFCVTTEGVKSVTFKGNNGEALAGTAKVVFGEDGKPVVREIINPQTEITLSAPEGTTLEVGKWYFIVAYPIILQAGYELTLTHLDGTYAVKHSVSEVFLKRSIWGVLDKSDLSLDYDIPQNEIWYTSTNGEPIQFSLVSTYTDPLLLVSNTYSDGLGKVVFNKDLTTVPSLFKSAIERAPLLKTAILPNGVKELDETFMGCSNLESVVIPQSVTTIGNLAFSGCKTIANIEIPQGVSVIGESAFYGCISLTEIQLPDYLKTMGRSAFSHCSSLASISIPDKIEEIIDCTFEYCENLKEVLWGKGLKKINNGAFQFSGLEQLALPEGLLFIGNSAYKDCYSLREIIIPDSVETIGNRAFENNVNAQTITVGLGFKETVCQDDDDSPFNNCSGRLTVNATNIPKQAFAKNAFTEISFGETISSIGANAFRKMKYLEKITIPGNVKTIGQASFSDCEQLKSIVISEGVKEIGMSAFSGCIFGSVDIPSTIDSLARGAFEGNLSLKTVTIKEGAKGICSGVFRRCEIESFTGAYAKDSGKVLVDNEVLLAYALNSESDVNISEECQIKEIGCWVFGSPRNYNTITIPSSVERVGDHCFFGATINTLVLYANHPPTIAEDAFGNATIKQIVVPTTSLDEYKNAPGWNSFSAIIQSQVSAD